MNTWSLRAWHARWWAVRAMVHARRGIRRPRYDASQLPLPPRLGESVTPAVAGVLKRLRASCFVRSLVLQRWHAAHGSRRDLIIGVRSPREGFAAHAWLEGDPPGIAGDFVELSRQPAPG